MPVQAITPDEAIVAKFEKHVPEEVIAAANELIAANLDSSGRATFTQDALVKLIQKKRPKTTSETIYKGKWLDIEPFYEAAGWKVVYDKPAYNESYAATFAFSRAK
jgi:hypothetical protein